MIEKIIGNNPYTGFYSTIQLHKERKVVIGVHCRMNSNVRFHTSSGNPYDDFTLSETRPVIKGDIIIGNDVWIGTNIFINPAIKISNNAILTKDVHLKTIVGGVPVRVIHYKDI